MGLHGKKFNHANSDLVLLVQDKKLLDDLRCLDSTIFKAIVASVEAYQAYTVTPETQAAIADVQGEIDAHAPWDQAWISMLTEAQSDMDKLVTLTGSMAELKTAHNAKLSVLKSELGKLNNAQTLHAIGAYEAQLLTSKTVAGDGTRTILTGKVFRLEAHNRKAFAVFAQDYNNKERAFRFRVFVQVVGQGDLVELEHGCEVKSATRARMLLSYCLENSHCPEMHVVLEDWRDGGYTKKDSLGLGKKTATGHDLFVDCGFSQDWLKRIDA